VQYELLAPQEPKEVSLLGYRESLLLEDNPDKGCTGKNRSLGIHSFHWLIDLYGLRTCSLFLKTKYYSRNV
jgi:hypothetical protein